MNTTLTLYYVEAYFIIREENLINGVKRGNFIMPALPKEFSKKQEEEEGERDLSLVDKLFSRKSDPFVESRPSSLPHPHPHPHLPLHRETTTHSHPHPPLLLTPSSSSQVIESRMISSSSSSSKTMINPPPSLPPHLIVN